MTDTTTPEVTAFTSGDAQPQPETPQEAPVQPEPTAQNGSQSEEQPRRERKGPGRPRVPEVVQRDETVLGQLQQNGSQQVRNIAESVGITKNAAYLSLWRLRREGKVEYARDGKNRMWSAVA